jgi:hypothetical protein
MPEMKLSRLESRAWRSRRAPTRAPSPASSRPRWCRSGCGWRLCSSRVSRG